MNLKLFAPEPNRKKAVLLFVIRDKTKTPMVKLIEVLEQDLTKMWDSISKPPIYKESKLVDFFDVSSRMMEAFVTHTEANAHTHSLECRCNTQPCHITRKSTRTLWRTQSC